MKESVYIDFWYVIAEMFQVSFFKQHKAALLLTIQYVPQNKHTIFVWFFSVVITAAIIRGGGGGFICLIWIPVWITNYNNYKVWDEINYPFIGIDN